MDKHYRLQRLLIYGFMLLLTFFEYFSLLGRSDEFHTFSRANTTRAILTSGNTVSSELACFEE